MSKTAVASSVCALSLLLFTACKSGDDDDSTPGMMAGTGGVAPVGSGGVVAASAEAAALRWPQAVEPAVRRCSEAAVRRAARQARVLPV